MSNEYFAVKEDVGKCLIEKVEQYYNYINATRQIDLWRDLYRYYYYGYYSKGNILKEGKQYEKRSVSFNHFKSLLEHIKILCTSQRPTFEPRAVNSDYESAAQVILARGLLDYYMRQKNLEEVLDNALEFALMSGEGWIFQEWDSSLGKVTGQTEPELDDDGEIKKPSITLHEGDIRSFSFHPVDVVRDWTKQTTEDNLWFIVRRYVNKYELAARYPEFKEDIEGQELEKKIKYNTMLDDFSGDKFYDDSDQISLYIFRHKKSAVLPEGREVQFLEDGTALLDVDLPYDDVMISRIMPVKQKDTNFGYTCAMDLLPCQKVLNMLDSTIVTNQNAFGVQIICAQKGSGVDANELATGLTLLQYNGEKPPEALRILATPAEIFNYKQDVIQQMETISGVNSVTRGNPEASLKSGAALALVQSLTIQYNSGIQKENSMLLENVGTNLIKILQRYADSLRVAMVAGKSKIPLMKEFRGKDLELIDRVVVDAGNPMSKTLSGRISIADTLLERGLIKNPEQYITLIQTGQLEPLIEADSAELLLIKDENEKLFRGEQVPVVVIEQHRLHIREHSIVLKSSDAKKMVNVVKTTLAHINEHLMQLRAADPELLLLLGEQPLGQGGPPPPPQMVENSPEQAQAGPGQFQMEPALMGAEGENMPSLPSQPTNPLTGNEFNNITGGL